MESTPSSSSRRFVSKEDTAEEEYEKGVEDKWDAPLAAYFLAQNPDDFLALCHSLLEEKVGREERRKKKREERPKVVRALGTSHPIGRGNRQKLRPMRKSRMRERMGSKG